MKVYFFDATTEQAVSAESPLEMNFQECRRLLNKMRIEGSFLGVMLDEFRVLQIRCEKDRLFWLEILDRKNRVTDGCDVNLAIAEIALEAAAVGGSIKDSLNACYLNWAAKPLDSEC